jgi:glycosyltransferase involved in cell wall biosynthesis
VPATVLYAVFHSQLGGAELALLGLLETLDAARFRSIVLVAEEGPLVDMLRRRAVPVLVESRMRVISRRSLSAAQISTYVRTRASVIRGIAGAVQTHRVDLIHAFVAATLGYAGRAARMAGVPIVGTVHEPLTAFAWPRRRLLVAALNRFCDGVTFPSEANRAMALRFGVRPDRATVIRTGIDLDRFRMDPEGGWRVRRELGVAPGVPFIGMVARFNPGKGHDVLLRAMALVAGSHPDASCVLVGDALFRGELEWKTRMRALAGDLGLGDRVVFAGWRDDVPAVLSALDILVHPPTTPDSLPGAVLEAMAVGRPVVAAAIGGLPEIVEEGVTGYLVPPRNAGALASTLCGLLGDPAARANMGAAGRRRVAHEFPRERFGQAMEELYERIRRAAASVP